MLTIPNILNSDEFLNTPLNYDWNGGSSSFYVVDAQNEKIGRALWLLNHKATLGIATALGEWIFWRLSSYTDRPKVNQILEAHWAGVINKHYFFNWAFEEEYLSDVLEGPTWAMLSCLQYPRTIYFQGGFFINKKVSNLAMLARHITSNKKFFDDWFSHILAKSSKLFPAQYDRQEILDNYDNYEDEIYDSSQEPAIPRDYYWKKDYSFEKINNVNTINNFLNSLNYEESEFILKPKEMIGEGFDGIPYKYKE